MRHLQSSPSALGRSRRFVAALLVAFVLAIQGAQAAGTVTVTTTDAGDGVTKYVIAWTSTAGGAVSGNAFAVKRGYLVAAKVMPAAGGSAPTTLYDITLVDQDAVDLLNALAADQSATVGRYFVFDPAFYLDSTQTLDLVIANAGSAKSGTVTLWIR